MAQHDYVISNASGSAVRSDLNNALAAIVTTNSGSSEPTTTYAYQFWADTSAGVLKIRNGANNAWITLRELDGTFLSEDGSAASPGIAFASDTNTGLYRIGADQIGFSTGGTLRATLDSSGRLLVGTSSAVGSVGSAAGDITPQQQLVGSTFAASSAAIVRTAGGSAQLFFAAGSSANNQSSDSRIGGIYFNGYHTDAYYQAASIEGFSDTPAIGAGDMPGRLVFSTTADGASSPTERVRLDSSGRLGIGTSSPSALLHVNGDAIITGNASIPSVSPPGTVQFFAGSTAPTGWLKANGAVVSRSTYSSLFAAIGTTYGVGNGSTTFALPDMRGEFPRCWDDGRGVDSGRGIGSWQSQNYQSHGHGVNDSGHFHGSNQYWMNATGSAFATLSANGIWQNVINSADLAATTGISIQNSGGTETRPRNIALLAIIKY